MFNKKKRVLWLLNHRTLMPYEAPLIRRLGFEIYIPKIIPKYGFRSGAVDASFDESLTLPPKVLDVLNAFNFYEDEWTPEITKLVNRYFGTAFVIPQARLTAEAVDNFEGQLILRAFGLNNENTYTQFLDDLHGPLVMRKIKGIRERFWFGESYDHLHECEEAFFVERSLFLPIGIPDSFFSTARQWTGVDKKILFVCPNAVSDTYYANVYANFKRDFGDLPHVIVGTQDVPMSDPHVLGFVSDAELKRLYLECAVLYYHSNEIRHVHYSPIEAAINGMPIVFFKGSLLDRMGHNTTKGRVSTIEEARSLVERILADDRPLIDELTESQQTIAHHFSDAYCSVEWKRNMEQSGFMLALNRESLPQIAWKEIKRSLMMPIGHGRTVVDPHRDAKTPPTATLSAGQAKTAFGVSLFDGVDFSKPRYTPALHYVTGLGPAESWGRWSNNHSIMIVAKHLLVGKFRLYVRAVGYEKNAGVPVSVRIGSQTRCLELASDIKAVTGAWLHFELEEPSNVIEIEVPFPTSPAKDTRFVGIGMIEMRVAPPVTLSSSAAPMVLGTSLADGLVFSTVESPAFLSVMEGLGEFEPWGRWSIGARVRLELNHTLEGHFALLFNAIAYGPNISADITVTVGEQTRILRLPGALEHPDDEVAVEFDLKEPSNVIDIAIPHPTIPPGDNRRLGVGFFRLRNEVIDSSRAFATDGSSLADGLLFKTAKAPEFIRAMEGVGEAEPWGRWSTDAQVRFELAHTLEGRFALKFNAVCYGPNIGADVTVTIGQQIRILHLPGALEHPDDEVSIEFDLEEPSNVIEITIPHPTTPPGDNRRLGIGFFRLRSVPVETIGA